MTKTTIKAPSSVVASATSSNRSRGYLNGSVRSGGPALLGSAATLEIEATVRTRVDGLEIVPSELVSEGFSRRPVAITKDLKPGRGKPVFDNTRWGSGARAPWKKGFNFL